MYFRGYVSGGSYLYQYRQQEYKNYPGLTHTHQLNPQAKCGSTVSLQQAHAPTQQYTHKTHTPIRAKLVSWKGNKYIVRLADLSPFPIINWRAIWPTARTVS